ncbi:hypothetical protein [Candidatus Chromulinivorax destructor]|uniref:Uncharacterized protein n=1 Tax=Candidatus Chromulinivorax destructor TaxID=2066483 RepID=A0A345ZBR2_9BACT|nr:hypothetical protein [Candidatus Chromulinivorax destructor]AXK60729.1 hypothetical protein C0J27_03160 [Candidatus Chromulinivorax destructor]
MNLFALLSGIIFMMHPIEKFKIPHDCHKIESAIEKIAYGQFATLHYDQDIYNKLTALLEKTHTILNCDDKILEDRNKRALDHNSLIQDFNHIYHEYHMAQKHNEHCPEITSYLEKNKNIDLTQLSDHEQEAFSVMQDMRRSLQCDKECYQSFDILEIYSHKK